MTASKGPLFSLMLGCLSSLLVGGCYVQGQAGADVAAAPPPPAGEVVVESPPPPPPPVVEAPPPPPPQPELVYVQGYHRWDGRVYVWERGHYERPPRRNAHLVPAHWEARGRGKVWINARWD